VVEIIGLQRQRRAGARGQRRTERGLGGGEGGLVEAGAELEAYDRVAQQEAQRGEPRGRDGAACSA